MLTPSCLILRDPMGCSSPGSSVHGILQATILEWVAVSYSRGSSQPRDQNHISYVCLLSFPPSSVDKESACNAGDLGPIPGSGRFPEEGNGKPLQYSCLENPMDRGAWQAAVHGVTRVGHDVEAKPPPSAP